MKAVVLAYHNIGCAGLEALIRNGFEICAVFTHCDDKNENTWFRSVAELAAGRGIPVFAPEDINHPLWVEKIRAMRPDFIFSFYYRKLVKRPILEVPTRGCLNLHSSLLPKYRGRCPINWVLVNGESETGVTLHYMTERADDGDIVGQARIPIADQDTALTLFEKAEKAASDILDKFLPMLKSGSAPRLPQDHGAATYFGGRRPEDGKINWQKPARETANLVRAVARPYPGAYFTVRDKKVIVWQSQVEPLRRPADPGRVISADPFVVACGESALKIVGAQVEGGIFCSGPQAAAQLGLVKDMVLEKQWITGPAQKKKVLILGVNGFIGNALSEFLLDRGGYEVHGMDLGSDKITRLLKKPDFFFFEGDISIHREWIEYHVRKCDIILPLVAIATPIEYTRNPLRVFSLDFEENLRIVRYCAKYRKRIVFPSTSEVYGMCDDNEFDEDNSRLILGPIRMQRWIYSCSKQLLDRVIWAYGRQEGLKFTLFRPFNWIGPRLDSLMSARIGSSRAITQLILNLVEGSPILLVDGGAQKRCFTDVKDGVDCLCRIIENKNSACDGQIFNIGNPDNEASIAGLADILVKKFDQHPLRNKFPPCAGIHQVESRSYYGQGYQDVEFRKPSIRKARSILGWTPAIGLEQSVEETLDFFLREAAQNA